jgi:hypothetical protein
LLTDFVGKADAGHETATAILPFFLVSVGGSAAILGLPHGGLPLRRLNQPSRRRGTLGRAVN